MCFEFYQTNVYTYDGCLIKRSSYTALILDIRRLDLMSVLPNKRRWLSNFSVEISGVFHATEFDAHNFYMSEDTRHNTIEYHPNVDLT